MSEMTIPESRARLGFLLSEMLSLPNLPADLNQMISSHLQQQLSLVNILKPEYCLRLYPVLAELAELSAKADQSQSPVEVATLDEAPAEVVNGAAHEQDEHFDMSSDEQESQDEQSDGY